MIMKRNELRKLRDELVRLTDFICDMEAGHLPDFYRYFDAMKNNIEIYLSVGDEDAEDFFPVLLRDWKASHAVLIGVQDYDLRENNPDADPAMNVFFARLVSNVGSFFSCAPTENEEEREEI